MGLPPSGRRRLRAGGAEGRRGAGLGAAGGRQLVPGGAAARLRPGPGAPVGVAAPRRAAVPGARQLPRGLRRRRFLRLRPGQHPRHLPQQGEGAATHLLPGAGGPRAPLRWQLPPLPAAGGPGVHRGSAGIYLITGPCAPAVPRGRFGEARRALGCPAWKMGELRAPRVLHCAPWKSLHCAP